MHRPYGDVLKSVRCLGTGGEPPPLRWDLNCYKIQERTTNGRPYDFSAEPIQKHYKQHTPKGGFQRGIAVGRELPPREYPAALQRGDMRCRCRGVRAAGMETPLVV